MHMHTPILGSVANLYTVHTHTSTPQTYIVDAHAYLHACLHTGTVEYFFVCACLYTCILAHIQYVWAHLHIRISSLKVTFKCMHLYLHNTPVHTRSVTFGYTYTGHNDAHSHILVYTLTCHDTNKFGALHLYDYIMDTCTNACPANTMFVNLISQFG